MKNKMNKEYTPFGKEWQAEMNKHSKAELIMAIAKLSITLQAFETKSDNTAPSSTTMNVVKLETGISLIAKERQQQVDKHGRTIERDCIENHNGQLALGAEMLLAIEHEEGIDSYSYPDGWGEELCSKMLAKPYKERLVIAGALIAAELDRLNHSE